MPKREEKAGKMGSYLTNDFAHWAVDGGRTEDQGAPFLDFFYQN